MHAGEDQSKRSAGSKEGFCGNKIRRSKINHDNLIIVAALIPLLFLAFYLSPFDYLTGNLNT